MNLPLWARGALSIVVMVAAALLSMATHSIPVKEPWPELLSSTPPDPEFAALHERAKLALNSLGQMPGKP
jgi:hypothetical protein